jgi:hypothetical protein
LGFRLASSQLSLSCWSRLTDFSAQSALCKSPAAWRGFFVGPTFFTEVYVRHHYKSSSKIDFRKHVKLESAPFEPTPPPKYLAQGKGGSLAVVFGRHSHEGE